MHTPAGPAVPPVRIDDPRPALAGERVDVLDALRGFALLGILLVNLAAWSVWGFLEPADKAALSGPLAAEATDFLTTLLVEGKFYTVFSLLFGIGFALQLARLEQRDSDALPIYRRRLAVLMAIGLIHMTFIWEGDILTLYAALGFVLLAVRKASDRNLLAAAALLILLPIPGYGLVWALGLPPDLGFYGIGGTVFEALGGDMEAQPVDWLQRQDWASYWAWTLSGPPFHLGFYFESWRLPKVAAIMMLGLWAGRRLVAGTLLADRALLRRVLLWGLLLGIPGNLAYAALDGLQQETGPAGFLATAAYALGVVPLGLAYAAGFVLLWPRARRLLGVLAAPGRMALTNYLTHSLLGIAIFYGVGFGLAGRVPLHICYAGALVVFALQIGLSRLWLQAFRFGPLEWLWRCLTYRRLFALARPRPRPA